MGSFFRNCSGVLSSCLLISAVGVTAPISTTPPSNSYYEYRYEPMFKYNSSCKYYTYNASSSDGSISICSGGDFMNLNYNLKKLDSFCSNKIDWASIGMSPFNLQFIEEIKFLVENLKMQPKIFPTGNGSIQLEYYDKSSPEKYLEFEIFSDRAEMFVVDSNGNERQEVIARDAQIINRAVEKFYES